MRLARSPEGKSYVTQAFPRHADEGLVIGVAAIRRRYETLGKLILPEILEPIGCQGRVANGGHD